MTNLESPHCYSSCQAKLPDGWLSWLFLELKSYNVWYSEKRFHLLFEILGATLPVDVLILDHGKNTTTRLHNLKENSEAKNISDFLKKEKKLDRWSICNAKTHGITSFPRPTSTGNRLYLRRISTSKDKGDDSVRHVILGVFVKSKPRQVICDRCFERIGVFLDDLEASPCHVAAMYTPPENELTRERIESRFDEKGDALSRLVTASINWFYTLLGSYSRTLPTEYHDELSEVASTLKNHAFSLSVAFNYEVILREPGFGYFLTPAQEDQINSRLTRSPRDKALTKRLLQGTHFSTDEIKGLVHYVTETGRGHAIWSRDIFAERLYYPETEPFPKGLENLEDIVVHRPSIGANTNFIFEAPIYGYPEYKHEHDIVAVFFFVLQRRYSAPIGGILYVAARMALQQLLLGIDAALGDRARDDYRRRRYNPLLMSEVEHGFLQTLFPRTGARDFPYHNIEDFFIAPWDRLIKRVKKTRNLPEFHVLREHGDTYPITRSIDNILESEENDHEELRWALTCLKTRVRVAEEGNQNSPYLLDVFHYLVGWHWWGDIDGEFKDLDVILGPGHRRNLTFLKKAEVRLTIRNRVDSPNGADRDVVVASRKWEEVEDKKWEVWGLDLWHVRGKPGRRERNPVSAGWASWATNGRNNIPKDDLGLPIFMARISIPKYESGTAPLAVFLKALLERVGEQRPKVLELLLDWPRDRCLIQCLWKDEKGLVHKPAIQLWPPPDRERTNGGDLGTVWRDIDGETYTGWFVSLPIQWEKAPPN